MEQIKDSEVSPKILQIAHGRIIPKFSSAYSLRCHSLLRISNRKLISFAGAIYRDEKMDYAEQYRSFVVSVLSLIKGNRILEIYISKGKFLRKKYLKRLRELVTQSDIIIFEGPWQYNLVKDFLDKKFVVYDAHNVEYSLREKNKFKKECKLVESALVNRAEIVLVVTKRDLKIFKEMYDINESKLFFSPHTVNVAGTLWVGYKSDHIVFIGSIYGPNNSALLKIYEFAKAFPEYTFDVIGSVRGPHKLKLKNLILHGIVDDKTKDEIMSNSLIALNPVSEGSGRNVKMMDYLAHGLPILSTPLGVRGFEEYDLSDAVYVAHLEQFKEAIKKLSEDRERLKQMSDNAIKIYENILKSEGSIEPEDKILSKYRHQT